MLTHTQTQAHTKKQAETYISLYPVLGSWLTRQKGLEKSGIESGGWEQEGLEEAGKTGRKIWQCAHRLDDLSMRQFP